jgi:hypothetical protein
MKEARNNEIDLLLRSLAKGRDESAQRGSASAGGNGAFPDHLDADEMNSYAEGVVPAAARARYAAHLADCNVCRRMVIDLSQAAGVANRLEAPAPQRGAGFWQKLAAIFSPVVLRFAVPALVLTAVIGIGLVALLQEKQTGPIAQNQEQPNVAAPPEQLKQAQAPTGNSSNAPPAAPAKEGVSPGVSSPVDQSTVYKNDRDEKPADTGAPALSGGTFGTATPLAKDGRAPAKAGEDAASRPYAPEPKTGAPASAPPAAPTESDEVTRAKELPAKREEAQQRQRDDFRGQPEDVHGPNRGAAQRSGPSNNASNNAQQNVAGLNVRRSGPNAEDKKAKADSNEKAKSNDVETRYVSGRKFAREDNAWIDTAYESSRTTIKVKRGSEQFRALVADEPGLGAIANELKGTVIVVWKNRAYRIQ